MERTFQFNIRPANATEQLDANKNDSSVSNTGQPLHNNSDDAQLPHHSSSNVAALSTLSTVAQSTAISGTLPLRSTPATVISVPSPAQQQQPLTAPPAKQPTPAVLKAKPTRIQKYRKLQLPLTHPLIANKLLPQPQHKELRYVIPRERLLDYVDVLNDQIIEAAANKRMPPPVSNHAFHNAPRVQQVGCSTWTRDELSLLFDALARYGRHDLPALASAVGKTAPQVHEYVSMLADALAERLAQHPKSGEKAAWTVPAALEISALVCKDVENTAANLEQADMKAAEAEEYARWGDSWLLTSELAAHIAEEYEVQEKEADETEMDGFLYFRHYGKSTRALPAPQGIGDLDEDSLLGHVPSANLLHLPNMLSLQRNLFMHKMVEDPELVYTVTTEPTIRHTALLDIHTLVVSFMRRVISTVLFQTETRTRLADARADDYDKKHRQEPIVSLRDVHAAFDMLGIKRDAWWSFWVGVPRRHQLAVKVRKYRPQEIDLLVKPGYVPLDDVERALRTRKQKVRPPAKDLPGRQPTDTDSELDAEGETDDEAIIPGGQVVEGSSPDGAESDDVESEGKESEEVDSEEIRSESEHYTQSDISIAEALEQEEENEALTGEEMMEMYSATYDSSYKTSSQAIFGKQMQGMMDLLNDEAAEETILEQQDMEASREEETMLANMLKPKGSRDRRVRLTDTQIRLKQHEDMMAAQNSSHATQENGDEESDDPNDEEEYEDEDESMDDEEEADPMDLDDPDQATIADIKGKKSRTKGSFKFSRAWKTWHAERQGDWRDKMTYISEWETAHLQKKTG
ncbi:hypothetical protein BT63DRAFT_427573 [Microthyrium microscopicum]|uniref:Myb-like domain-containing protein n=1 Tax=Microthyrium microscopicum TaxID=703497 RepID=A0A6A6U687_9PEZI|nr:hypothetical protein BT63DRAFT_427573 [Microthyrium microscopicum]